MIVLGTELTVVREVDTWADAGFANGEVQPWRTLKWVGKPHCQITDLPTLPSLGWLYLQSCLRGVSQCTTPPEEFHASNRWFCGKEKGGGSRSPWIHPWAGSCSSSSSTSTSTSSSVVHGWRVRKLLQQSGYSRFQKLKAGMMRSQFVTCSAPYAPLSNVGCTVSLVETLYRGDSDVTRAGSCWCHWDKLILMSPGQADFMSLGQADFMSLGQADFMSLGQADFMSLGQAQHYIWQLSYRTAQFAKM